MKRVVLVGNPNTGKSLLFSRLTKTGAISANYAGTTAEIQAGRFTWQGEVYEVADGPGLYSLEGGSDSDRRALELLDKADIILDVVDSTNLERNLGLSLELLALGKPAIVCLNLWDDTRHKGITIDVPGLEDLLGVPVRPVSALSGEGVNELVAAFPAARTASGKAAATVDERWKKVGAIVVAVQRLEHRHHKPLERLSDFTLHPVGGIVSALAVLVTTLLAVRFLGEWLVSDVLGPAYSGVWAPAISGLAGHIPWAFLRGILVGYGTDPLESFGVLTSGVYIAFVQVFPYFVAFYLVFGILEDSGYLPRLAVVLDRSFHRLGLHGYSSIPVMLGLGCKVPAFLSARMLGDRREKVLTITLILMSAPCLPQTSMIIAYGMNYGIGVVLAVFAVLVVIALAVNVASNRLWKGERTEFFAEIPSYRMPRLPLMARKLWMRVKEYLGEVIPMIALGVLVMNILEAVGAIGFITKAIQAPVAFLFGLPAELAPIMLLGFLRKDVSIALLAPLALSGRQFLVAAVFLSLYTPCISAFFTLIRETGTRTGLRIVLLVFCSATAAAALLHLALG